MAPMSVNQNSPKSFKKELPHTSWMLVTCSIHIANNASLEGIKCLKDNVNVDQFAIGKARQSFQTICSEKKRL